MDWLSTVVTMLVGVLGGALAGGFSTYWFNVRFSRKQDKKARDARFHGLEREIEANLLLVDAEHFYIEGGKPRLLANALQKSQDDWFTLETTLQENLQKLYSEILIYNDCVELVIRGTVDSTAYLNQFFTIKSEDIKKLLEACQEALSSITSPDPKK